MAEIDLLRLRAKAKLKLKASGQISDGNDSALVEQFRPIIKKMESGDRYDIRHPKVKSGQQALGAYGVMPKIWFDQFPELGLDSNSPDSEDFFLKNKTVQDEMFTKIALKGIKETGGDPAKFRAWYYGGPNAVKNIERGTGDKKHTAYDSQGNQISMPSHATDSQMFTKMLNGEQDIEPEAMQTLDSRALAGLPPLRYPNREATDQANELYNNAEAQAARVQEGKQQAISDLPLREQMGAGMGAFAYKMPGMGQLSEMAGLAPKGSAKNKKAEVEEYNQNRTMGQMAGELIPDVAAATLGGLGASQALKVANLAKYTRAGRYAAEGATAGGASATIHQAQHVGSGQGFKPKEAAAEVIIAATLGTLGGKLGDKLVEAAPKVLRRSLKPTLSESMATNPPDYTAALDNNLIPRSGNLEEAAARSEKLLASLEAKRVAAARAASQEPIPPAPQQMAPAPAPVAPPPVVVQPVAPSPVAPSPVAPVAQAPVPPAPVAPRTPGQWPVSPEEQVARRTAMAEADKAKRMAEAARRRAEPPAPVTKPKEQPTTLSSLASKQAALREPKVAPKVDKGFTKADQALLDEAKNAEKALALQKKLKGQRGSIDMSWLSGKKPVPEGIKLAEKPPKGMVEYNAPDGEKYFMDPGSAKKAKEADEMLSTNRMMGDAAPTPKGIKLAEKPTVANPNQNRYNPDKFTTGKEAARAEVDNASKSTKPLSKPSVVNTVAKDEWDKFKGQRGSIEMSWMSGKKKAPTPQVPMREVKKVGFVDGPLKKSRETLDKEISGPTTNKFTTETYDEAKAAFDYWEKEAMKRPTVKGDKNAQMTVEDALSLRQAIDKEIKFRKTQGTITDGFNKGSLMLREDLNKTIAEAAPEVGKLTEKEARIVPFKKSLDTRVEKNLNAHIPNATIRLAGLAGGGLIGAADSKNRKSGAISGAIAGLTLAQLATTPGGAAILYKTGKSFQQNKSLRRATANQLMRSSAVKSREKK